MKLYEGYVDLWTMFINTLSNEEMTKIKVVELDEFYNFYVHDFSGWSHLIFQNDVWSCYFFEIQNSNR